MNSALNRTGIQIWTNHEITKYFRKGQATHNWSRLGARTADREIARMFLGGGH